jgi:hypothetical protein
MTTGRINQVAFLTDAGAARGSSSLSGRRLVTTARQSYATSDESLYRTNLRPMTSCPRGVPHPRYRATGHVATEPARSEQRGTQKALSGPPRATDGNARRKGANGTSEYLLQVCNTRNQRSAQGTRALGPQMKRQAQADVAAQAGIQPTRTSRPPLTRHHVQSERSHKFDANHRLGQ